MAGMPLRTDRILRYVVAFCAACHREHPDRPLGLVPRLSGYLAEQDGKVWLVRGCPRHGKVVTLYDEVPEILRYLEEWTAPTKVHTPDTLGNYDPVPAAYLRGLGEMQTQHTCILLEEITEQCNLRCPTCFADSSPQLTGVVPLDQVLENVDRRLAREHGRLDVLMISGGEPTVYPRLLELLERVLERDIIRILINTNGIQIARSDELLDFLTRHNDRIEIYLQFDGFKPETLRHHRNADLRRVKREAVERLSGAGIFTTLTMTAALGVNDDEIGAVVRYGLATPVVERTSLTDPTVTDLFRNICENCVLGLSTLLRLAGSALLGQRDRMRRFFGERIKRITIKPFMDMDTMLEERLLQCCVHVGTQSDAQHQCAPFCAVQAWPALARQKPAARAGSPARPLELAAPPV